MAVFNIEEFGASTEGGLCTAAIQKAINACALVRGTVEVPRGTFQTGTIQLFSGVTLYLAKGAVLQGSANLSDYPEVGVVHNEWGPVRTLVWADRADGVSIRGEGKIDFNGSAFFDFARPHSSKLDVSRLSPAQREEFDVYSAGRPNQAIFLRDCSNILVSGIELADSPCWGLCLSSCDGVRIADIKIRFSKRIPNADGIHLSSCRNAIITGCDIVTGDDAIAITGINDWTRETQNILVANCLLSSSSAGIRIGYWHSRVRDVRVENCVIYDSVRGITVTSCGSGYVDNVAVSAVSVNTRGLAGSWWGMGEGLYISALDHDVHNHETAVIDPVPQESNIRNLTFRDVTLSVEFGVILIADRYNIGNVRFFNTEITMRNSSNRKFFGDSLDLKPSAQARNVPANSAYWLYAEQVDSLLIADWRVTSELLGEVSQATSQLRDCRAVTIRDLETVGQEVMAPA